MRRKIIITLIVVTIIVIPFSIVMAQMIIDYFNEDLNNIDINDDKIISEDLDNSSNAIVNSVDINEDGKTDYTINLQTTNDKYKICYEKENLVENTYMKEKEIFYSVKKEQDIVGVLEFTLQQILGESYVYFLEYKPIKDVTDVILKIDSINMGKDFTIRSAYYDENNISFDIFEDFEKIKALNNTSHYIDYNNDINPRFMRIGKLYFAKDLGSKVIDVEFPSISTIDILNKNNNISFNILVPSQIGSSTRLEGILSLSPIANWEHDFAVATAKVMDLTEQKLFWKDGVYHPNPYNYIPRGESSFYRIPSALQIRATYWVLDQGSLFKSHGVSMMYAYTKAYNDKGFIPTLSLSEWLKSDYDIDSGFYDTRFNTDTAMALLNIYIRYPDEQVLEKINSYFEFFKEFADKHHFIVDEKFYVPDYIDYDENNKKTHSSLNHMIAEMTVLYQYYELTADEEILDLAHKLRDTITSSYKKWIKENGDLYYGITPGGEYYGDDYPLVTYNDLRYSFEYLEKIDGEVPEEFKTLFKSKEQWAKKNGYLK